MHHLIASVALAAFFVGLTAASAGTNPAKANITLQVIQCPRDRFAAPELSVAPATLFRSHAQYATIRTVPQNPNVGFYIFNIDLDQGNYLMRVASQDCSQTLQVAVLSGHKRVISVALRQGAISLVSLANATMGLLPIQPAFGWLVGENGAERSLDIQDQAFYLERVPPGHYILRLELHGGYESEIPIDLTGLTTDNYIRHDIGLGEFRKHLGNILATGKATQDCYWCY